MTFKTKVIGKLLNPISGKPAKDATIRFITVEGFKDLLRGSRSEFECNHDGNYDFELEIGVFAVFVRYHVAFEKMQTVTVNSDTPSPLTMYELLEQSPDEPLTPEQVDYINELTKQAEDAANLAGQYAQQVTEDKDAVAQNTKAVEADSQKVAENKESVEQTAADVATAQAVIGTSIDGVYANAAGLVSINDTILRLHPII